VYVGWHEMAALQWEDYSRISNAISELHLTGAPSKWMLDPWEGLVYNALLIAFGIGVWRSAQGSRSLRTVGGLQILSGAIFPLWLLSAKQASPLTSSLLYRHLDVARVNGVRRRSIRQRFRLYSLVSRMLLGALLRSFDA
jgi:hypothetical protein